MPPTDTTKFGSGQDKVCGYKIKFVSKNFTTFESQSGRRFNNDDDHDHDHDHDLDHDHEQGHDHDHDYDKRQLLT